MELLTGYGVPVLKIIIAGALIWATTQVCKRAIKHGKEKYLLYSGLGSLLVSCLVIATGETWSWLHFTWTAFGGWLAANLLHKFYAKYLKGLIEKNA